MRTLTIHLAVFAVAVARPQILDDVPSTTPHVPNVKTSGSADLEDRSIISVPSSQLPFSLPVEHLQDPYYPLNTAKTTQLPIYTARSSLLFSSGDSTFPFSTSALCFLSDVGVPYTYPPLSSFVTSAQYGFPIRNPVTGLYAIDFSSDNGGSFGNVMNTAQEAVMVNRPSIYVFAPEYLSFNDDRENPAYNTAASTTAPTDASADAAESVSRESNAEARPVSLPLGQPAVSLTSRIALRNAAAPFSLYPNTMAFGGVPVGARIQQDAAPSSPSPNMIYFGGVPVRVLGAPRY